MTAEYLRETAAQMRVDAFAVGDEATDFIPAVANLLDKVAAHYAFLLLAFSPEAAERAAGYTQALAVARAYRGDS